jgi:hypothetical protein
MQATGSILRYTRATSNRRHTCLRLCAILCTASLALTGCKTSTQSAWSGTWKLNLAKSQAYSHFTIAIAPGGIVTETSETRSVSFRCNNQDEFQMGLGQTTICATVNDKHWLMKNKVCGKVAQMTSWDISPDGRTLTIRSARVLRDKPQPLNEHIWTRASGTNGFAGRWQDTTPLKSRPKVLSISLDSQRLFLAYPDVDQFSEMPLDGSAVPVNSPRILPGFTTAIKAIKPREFDTQTMRGGKVTREGTYTLSDDGRTLLQQFWTPDDPAEKDRMVYDKQ